MPGTPSFAFSDRREIELDFLRGIAILLVVDFHATRPLIFIPLLWLGFPHFGWAGVDIFFVLSGFLIGGLLIKEATLFGYPDGRRFLIRRALKLWPQYYLLLAYLYFHKHVNLSELKASFVHLQNFLGMINLTWSLALEEQAYLFIVLFFTVAARLQASARQLITILASLAAVILGLRFTLALESTYSSAIMNTRVDGILYGVILAILYHERPAVFRKLQSQRWLLWLLAAAALTGFRFPRPTPVSVALQWVYGDVLAVCLFLLLQTHQPGLRSGWYRAIAKIGIYSYGIFLWYSAVIPEVYALEHRFPNALRTAWESIGTFLFAIPLGILTTRCIEFPALRIRDKLFPRRVDSAVGIPAIIEEEALSR